MGRESQAGRTRFTRPRRRMCVVGSHTRGEDIGATPSVVLSRAGEEMDEAAQTHARPDPPARQGEAPGRREPARRAGVAERPWV